MFSDDRDMVNFLGSTNLFSGCSVSALSFLASQVRIVRLEPGATLIEHGEPRNCLYLLARGRIRVVVGDGESEKVLSEPEVGQAINEMDLYSGEQAARVITTTECEFMALSRDVLRRLADLEPGRAEQIERTVAQSMRRTQLLLALHLSEMFDGLVEGALTDLEQELEFVHLRGGDILFNQGDVGDCLYIVITGRLRVVVRRDDEQERVVAELGRGEAVGEMALLGGEPRSATVYAVRDTELAKLSEEGFNRLLVRHPQAVTNSFVRRVVVRLRDQISGSSRPKRTVACIVVLPANQHLQLSEFCNRLVISLRDHGAAIHMDRTRLDASLGAPKSVSDGDRDIDDLRILNLLNRLETAYRYVIYEADAGATSWTQRCIRQADCIVVVGTGFTSPATIDPAILRILQSKSHAPRRLALLYDDRSRQPALTAEWLEATGAFRHHHVIRNEQDDYGRLSRSIIGGAVGLVLGGGFARGLAHAGVIRALREMGVPIDFVGGTSMGALIAAECAQLWDSTSMVEKTLLSSSNAFSDFTVPIVSLVSGNRHREGIYGHAGDLRIEDLWLPFFCVSTNLTRAEMNVHDHGSLVTSLLASTRAPGIFPPIADKGDLLVDGGLVNNLPVDVMRRFLNGGVLIAVDVSPAVALRSERDYGFGISGWRILAKKLNPLANQNDLPTIFGIIMRAIELTSQSHKRAAADLADLYIHVPLAQYKITDFKSGPEIAELGYQVAKKKIEEWRKETAIAGRAVA
jgi:NTE family protein